MKKDKGYSMIELMIVIAIMGICVGLAIPNLSNLVKKNRVESQIRRIYSDLMNARVMAMSRNITHFIVFAGSQYTVMEDTNLNGVPDAVPADTQRLRRSSVDIVPMTYSNTATTPPDAVILQSCGGWVAFNPRGIARTAIAPNGTIWITVPNVHPSRDCISISPTQMRLGKWDGATCNEI
jgi:prepilin-type N-terminal cleavage/methylation domain-containing protein